MKLLFDQNLSHRLVRNLESLFPDSTHVRDVGLQSATDDALWEYARGHGYAIVSKDADFHARGVLRGPPPKVVWIQRGNCTTREIMAILQLRHADILAFDQDEEAAFLALE